MRRGSPLITNRTSPDVPPSLGPMVLAVNVWLTTAAVTGVQANVRN